MNLKKNKLFISLLSLGLILLVTGISYAFFMYNKTGLYTHTINGGKMKVIYDEVTGNNITIENAYPLTDEEAEEKALEFEFTITGYNESDKNVYYAIEIDYGEDVENKIRFKDTDIKLTMLENDEIIIENEIYQNLDNQDIYYGTIWRGTSSQTPTINNYKMRIWINDKVIISDTIEDTISSWDEMDWRLIEDKLDYDELERINNNEVTNLSELGISIYTSEEFMNRYANFKINVRADLTYDDVGSLMYDANGGISTFTKSSLTTNMITTKKPVKENMGFLGWSSDPNAIVPEYYAGDSYSGEGKMLYAVYGEVRNVMGSFSTKINDQKSYITEAYFINDTEENIDVRYNASTIKSDLTYNNQGRVLGWLENDYYDETNSKQYYKLYVGSEGTTYLNTGNILFYGFVKMRKIDLKNTDTSDVVNMFGMFYDCYVLKELDVTMFDTSQVTNMGAMFAECNALKEIDVSNFSTSNVTNMSGMFGRPNTVGNPPIINSLELIKGLEKFDTSNVVDMRSMFKGCGNLLELNVSNFDTSKIRNMSQMFKECNKVTEIDVSGFNTSNVTDMNDMFYYCYSLIDLDLSNFNTSNVTSIHYMFSNCRSLKNLNLENFDTSNTNYMGKLFYNCQSLESLDINNFDTSKVTNMSRMFYGCSSLKKLNLNKLNTDNVTDMSGMFLGCRDLLNLDISNFNTNNVTNLEQMFQGCNSILNLTLSNFDTSKVTYMTHMFSGCNDLVELDLSNFDTSEVKNMACMFANCNNLNNLSVSEFDTSNVLSMMHMFESCSSLVELKINNFDTSKVTNMGNMFSGCSKIISLDLSNFDTSNVTSMVSMFRDCSNLEELNLSNFNTNNITQISSFPPTHIEYAAGMFQGCSNLMLLDISSFNFETIEKYQYAFYGMNSNATIYVGDTDDQTLILGISTEYRPSNWSTNNVIVKNA